MHLSYSVHAYLVYTFQTGFKKRKLDDNYEDTQVEYQLGKYVRIYSIYVYMYVITSMCLLNCYYLKYM